MGMEILMLLWGHIPSQSSASLFSSFPFFLFLHLLQMAKQILPTKPSLERCKYFPPGSNYLGAHEPPKAGNSKRVSKLGQLGERRSAAARNGRGPHEAEGDTCENEAEASGYFFSSASKTALACRARCPRRSRVYCVRICLPTPP